ncbi:helix-turn-helix domain-containing protein [Synergistaceae bacterium OttesenSCG-928-D05]|nr:helix-turn-helix domain-containing protein [Synergistaceae bacterium OttesenSCG-928-D05]
MYGKLIRERRQGLKLTQKALAEKVDVVRTTIIAWEMEKYPPTDCWNIAALEDCLGFDRGHLFTTIVEKTKRKK